MSRSWHERNSLSQISMFVRRDDAVIMKCLKMAMRDACRRSNPEDVFEIMNIRIDFEMAYEIDFGTLIIPEAEDVRELFSQGKDSDMHDELAEFLVCNLSRLYDDDDSLKIAFEACVSYLSEWHYEKYDNGRESYLTCQFYNHMYTYGYFDDRYEFPHEPYGIEPSFSFLRAVISAGFCQDLGSFQIKTLIEYFVADFDTPGHTTINSVALTKILFESDFSCGLTLRPQKEAGHIIDHNYYNGDRTKWSFVPGSGHKKRECVEITYLIDVLVAEM